jgi:hypothetical protein
MRLHELGVTCRATESDAFCLQSAIGTSEAGMGCSSLSHGTQAHRFYTKLVLTSVMTTTIFLGDRAKAEPASNRRTIHVS